MTITKAKKGGFVFLAVLEFYFCTAIFFGWPNLSKIFYEENFFGCANATSKESTETPFLERSKFCTKFDPLNYFLYGKLHAILKPRIVKICLGH